MREVIRNITKWVKESKDITTRLRMACAFIAGTVLVVVLSQIPAVNDIFSSQPEKYDLEVPLLPDAAEFSKPGGTSDSIRPPDHNIYELVYSNLEKAVLPG